MASTADPITVATRLVKQLIRAATAADSATLPEDALKPVKKFARQSDAHVIFIAEEAFKHLAKKDAQVRFIALELCATLWARSASFRRTLLERLVPEFVQLVGGEPASHPLPPPESWSERLPKRALELVESWDASHGQLDGYRGLTLARRYLRAALGGGGSVRGEAASSAGPASAAAELTARRVARLQTKYSEMRAEAEGALADMRRGADAMDACLRILAPSLEEGCAETNKAPDGSPAGGGGGASGGDDPFARLAASPSWRRGAAASSDEPGRNDDVGGGGEGGEGGEEEDDEAEADSLADGLLHAGMAGGDLELSLGDAEQRVEADRAPLIDALRDAAAEARNAFEPRLASWIVLLSRVGGTLPDAERPAHTRMLQRATDMRARLRAAMARAEPLLGSGGGEAATSAPADAHRHGVGATAPDPQPASAEASAERGAEGVAADGGGGDDDGGADDDFDDDDEFEDVSAYKDGYEPDWVDPDHGWEKPPPEAMRAPKLSSGRGGDMPEAATATRAGATHAPALPQHAPVSDVDLPQALPAAEGGDGQRCSAPRRDGSLCARWSSTSLPCPYHGVWLARHACNGRPTKPRPGSIWERLARDDEAQRTRESGGKEGELLLGRTEGEVAVHAIGAATNSTVGGARERPTAEKSVSKRSRGASSSTDTVSAPTMPPPAAPPPRRGKGKAAVSGRQRLASTIARGARAAAASELAHHVQTAVVQHKLSQPWM